MICYTMIVYYDIHMYVCICAYIYIYIYIYIYLYTHTCGCVEVGIVAHPFGQLLALDSKG